MIFFKTILLLTILSLWISNASAFAENTPANAATNVAAAKESVKKKDAEEKAVKEDPVSEDEEEAEEDDEEEDGEKGKKKPTYERYQSIVDRAPFGVPPPNFNPQAVPGSAAAAAAGGEDGGPMTAEQLSAEEQRIISEVQVSVLSLTPAGSTMVGFTDKASHKNYYLKVGSEKDGWKVVSADAAAQSVVLSKDGVEATVQVGSASSADKGKGAPANAAPANAAPASPLSASRPLGLARNAPATAEEPPAPMGGGGAMSRLRHRRMLERRKMQEEARLRREKEEHAKKETQQLRETVRQMEEKAEQDAIEREENKQNLARLMELSEALKRNRENQEASGEGQTAPFGEGQ